MYVNNLVEVLMALTSVKLLLYKLQLPTDIKHPVPRKLGQEILRPLILIWN